MKSTPRTSVRRLPSGSYIVSGVRSRSASTGRFVARSAAAKQPRMTVSGSSAKTAKPSSK